MLFEKLLSCRTSAIGVAEGKALALLHGDPGQSLALEKSIEQCHCTLDGSSVARAVDQHVFLAGGAVAKIQRCVVSVSQQQAGFQQLPYTEGRKLRQFAIARAQWKHWETVEGAEELSPRGPRVYGNIFQKVLIVLIDVVQLGIVGPVAGTIDRADVAHVSKWTAITVTYKYENAT